jgi:vancomycin resistance protein VanJ
VTAVPLVAFTVGPALWSYVPRSPPTVAGETITVMSVNLLHANTTTDPIVAEVIAARPDVLALEEYTPRWHRAFQEALADEHPYVCYVCRRDSFGQAIYARQPFVGPVDLTLPIGTVGVPQTRAVIRLAGREVALYNVHLIPPRRHDWAIEQRWEFADLIEQLERERLPVILCGDFNFTNASVFADELDRLGLSDAHRISGWGRGTTWPVLGFFRFLPGLRLDHVFLSRELTSTSSRTGIGRGSDHRPVVVEVGFVR